MIDVVSKYKWHMSIRPISRNIRSNNMQKPTVNRWGLRNGNWKEINLHPAAESLLLRLSYRHLRRLEMHLKANCIAILQDWILEKEFSSGGYLVLRL